MNLNLSKRSLRCSNPAVIKFAKKNGCSFEEAREELSKSPYFARIPDMLLVEMK